MNYLNKLISLTLPAALLASFSLASCSNIESEATDPDLDSNVIPEGFVSVQSGFVSYVMPEDWGYDPEVPGDLNRHIGAHESAPDIAAAEAIVYLDFADPEETEMNEAVEFLWEEFPFSEGFDASHIETTEIPGASEAARVDYVHSEFNRPEFDQYNTADFAIRAPNGELAAVRVGAVAEVVENGTFDTIIDSIEVVE